MSDLVALLGVPDQIPKQTIKQAFPEALSIAIYPLAVGQKLVVIGFNDDQGEWDTIILCNELENYFKIIWQRLFNDIKTLP